MQITDFTFTSLDTMKPVSSNIWKLMEDTNIHLNQPAGKGYIFTLKKGFVSNLRSGSDYMNPWIPRNGDEDMTISYILHDALYEWQGERKDIKLVKKEFADDLLKAMLQFCDECTNFVIAGLKENLKNEKDKNHKREIEEEIKFYKGQILGSAKIWMIHKAVALFGKSAWNEKPKIPFDRNYNKVFMEVL